MNLDLIIIVGSIVLISIFGLIITNVLKSKFKLKQSEINNSMQFSLYAIKIVSGLVNSYFEKYDNKNISKKNINKYINIIFEILEYLQTLPRDVSNEIKVKEAIDVVNMAQKFHDIKLNKDEEDIIRFVINIIVKLYPEFIE